MNLKKNHSFQKGKAEGIRGLKGVKKVKKVMEIK